MGHPPRSMQPWILALLLALAPRPFAVPSMPETQDAYEHRLNDVATQLAAQVKGSREAALMVALAYMESGFAVDADVGPCDLRLGRERCDGGRSVSMWQVMIANDETREGWDKADLFAHREHAIHEALQRVRRSLGACRAFGPDAVLDVYAGGRCSAPGELVRAKGLQRLALARRLLDRHPFPKL